MGDQPGSKGDQRRLRERRLRLVHAIQHQLPAPIHHRRLDHLIIGGTGVGLQDRRQPKLGRRDRWLPDRLVLVHLGKLALEIRIEQLMTVLAEPDKQPSPLDPLHDLLFQPRRRH
jgi:hypothetical protein